MLPAFAEGEANLSRLLTIACEDHMGLPPQVDEIVQQHQAEGDRDNDEVEELHEIENASARGGFGHDVDRPDGEAAAGIVVALAAGFAQAGLVDGRARIAGGVDVVHAVAA